MNKLLGVLAVVWTFLPLLAFPVALLGALLTVSIRGDRGVGRILAAFALAMLIDVPVRNVAAFLEQLHSYPALWPVGYGLLTLLYAACAAGLLVGRSMLAQFGLSLLRACGTEHEPGLRAGLKAGLFSLAVYYALQPAAILFLSQA